MDVDIATMGTLEVEVSHWMGEEVKIFYTLRGGRGLPEEGRMGTYEWEFVVYILYVHEKWSPQAMQELETKCLRNAGMKWSDSMTSDRVTERSRHRCNMLERVDRNAVK